MRKAGYVFAVIGLIQGLLVTIVGREAVPFPLLTGVALCMLAALVLLSISFIQRLIRGLIILRPFEAAKRVPVLFAIAAGVFLAVNWLFPTRERSVLEIVLTAAAFAIFFGFYTTMYRKPQ